MESFNAKIYKLGINPVVDPPDAVLASLFKVAGKTKGPIPVCGKINGADFTQTLVRFRSKWPLYVNAEMLKASGSKVGDEVGIEIEYDPRSREVPMPKVLKKALDGNKEAKIAFGNLPPSRQKEILKYIGSLKTGAAIEKNVARVLTRLAGDA